MFDAAAAAYSSIPGLVIRVYNSNQKLRDNDSETLAQDIAAQPADSLTFVFAWSWGVYNVNAFIQANAPIDTLYTIDGTTGPNSPVKLNLGSLASTVINMRSSGLDDLSLYGTEQNVANNVNYESIWTGFKNHGEFLDYLDNTFGLLDRFLRVSGTTAEVQQHQPVDLGSSIGDSGEGGTESLPLWAFQPASNAPAGVRPLDLTPVTSLNDLLPSSGPNGESANITSPPVVGVTTAMAATGRNYIDASSDASMAGVFLAETGTNIYEHDYVVCRRAHGYSVSEIAPVNYRGNFWWLISATNSATGDSEIAIPFVLCVSGTNVHVDSQYLVDLYGPKTFDKVYNFQIWAVSLPEATGLLDLVLQQISQHFNVQFDNTVTNSYPPVIVSSARYVAPNIRVDVINRTTNSIAVSFAGPVWTQPNFTSESIFSNVVTLQPGEQIIDLPVGGLHDAVIYVETGGLSDKFYISSGYWFPFDDTSSGGTSSIAFQQQPMLNSLIPQTAFWFANPPAVNLQAHITSTLSWSYAGLGYSLDPDNNPIDVSSATGIGFWTKGDKRHYLVKLESASITDGDYYGYTFVAPTNWTMVTVPFSALRQAGTGQPKPLSLKDVRTISFVTTERPYDAILSVDRVALLGVASPPLSISGSASNVTLVWPNAASTFVLNLASAPQSLQSGTTVTLRPQIFGTNYSLDLPATNSAIFFRLQRN